MAEELSALAKSLETSNDPTVIRNTKAAVVMKAKNLIGQVQDPMDVVMDHITKVFVASAARALMEIERRPYLHRNPSLSERQQTRLDLLEVLNSEPRRVQAFARGLSLFDAIYPVVGIYPFEDHHQAGNSPDRTLAVGIGGDRGLAMLGPRKGCPTLQGKMVLQDWKEVLDAITAEDLPGVERMEHDFFSPQPVKKAPKSTTSAASSTIG
ncbi:hypothetical protein EPUS_03979 [Endocarpon pusillum Z07020]|uniref:Uncharacterized protein n=1 Tax=Endocarpon pusillum (strain Z07020 / HMAS-L-300199) TaxID=1263415 RepID=U1HGL0_ENDPU|nr:uncharacterized protein EPUS_03979 [Endocarpon pusillum Z07020]ERF69275.1 hypothetical protein EPUS_03979 [Endocarpon pusillum Z07020]